MRRAIALGLILAMACTHEVRRERVVRRGDLGDAGATIVVADFVETEKSCAGDKVLLGVLTVLTLGIVYIIVEAADSKLGKPECPHRHTGYERQSTYATAFPVPSAPRRVAFRRPDPCVFPDDGCVKNEPSSTDRATRTPRASTWIEYQREGVYQVTIDDRVSGRQTIELRDEPWMKLGGPTALAPMAERVIVKPRSDSSKECWVVTRATNATTRFDGCGYVGWLDANTAFIGDRVVDADTGEAHPATDVLWLGKGLGLVDQNNDVVEVVRRHPWRVLATASPVGIVGEPDRVTIVGRNEVVIIRPTGDVDVHPLKVVPRRVLDVRGDLALVDLASEHLTAATIRLSTGEVVARTAEPARR